MKYASNGLNEPLMYEKLSIYTAAPGEDRKQYNSAKLIETVAANNSIVLIDCDFSTPIDYYRLAQEIYIVQDMNVLNVNLMAVFLKELKSRGIPMNKVRVIINKHVKCALTSKEILDRISTYVSPDLKIVEDLFPAEEMTYYILPFDQENYIKYIEMMYKYTNTFKTFTEGFKENIEQIVNAIYPVGIKPDDKNNKYTKKKKNLWDSFKKTSYIQSPQSSSGFEKVIE